MNEETKKELIIAIKDYRKTRLIGFGLPIIICVLSFIMDLFYKESVNVPNVSSDYMMLITIILFILCTIKFISVLVISNRLIKKIENSEITEENPLLKKITSGIKFHNKYMGGFKILRVLFMTLIALLIMALFIYVVYLIR